MGKKPIRRRVSKKSIEQATKDYSRHRSNAERLLSCLSEQFPSILENSGISMGVPLEARIKSIASVEEKLRRKGIVDLQNLDDLIGIRIILLFQEDVEKLDRVIKSQFNVVESEDASTRLSDTQFGYQSNHYVVRLPDEWVKLPSYGDLGHLKAEIQVRTLAQHIWAAASHKLQYKREESVPPPLRRSIHRVSALLETVDLEFTRVLQGRQEYVQDVGGHGDEARLNVDSVARILRELWPINNIYHDENYDELLIDLTIKGIYTGEDLRNYIIDNAARALEEERQMLESIEKYPDDFDFDEERFNRGVYFTHVGLTRMALAEA